MKYIDIHTHHLKHQSDVIAIYNQRAGLAEIDELVSAPVSFGLHPWDCDKFPFSEVIHKVNIFKQLYAIGECGFDKNSSSTLEIQKIVFTEHVELSERIHKPLIIHCVGIFNEIITLKNNLNPSQPWIIHGFSGHPKLADQLIKENFILSFGDSIFKPGSKAADSLRSLPSGTFFLETDESNRSIQEIYMQVGLIRGEDELYLIDLLYNQFMELFKQ
jgi:TatD DNase family protein